MDIVIYEILLSLIIIWIVKGIGLFKGYSPSISSGLILSTAFMNKANFGAPLVLFAFGERGFQYAIIIFTIHTIIMSTFGVYYAAKGKMDIKDAILSILKMPMIWGSVVGLLFQYFNVNLPENIYNAIDFVADASIPTVMLTLGMQLAEIKPRNIQWGKVYLAITMRLIISPMIACGIAYLLDVEPLLAKVMIVLAAMPTAAITAMYALQYDSEPDLVSSITLISTLLSIITLSILLTIFV